MRVQNYSFLLVAVAALVGLPACSADDPVAADNSVATDDPVTADNSAATDDPVTADNSAATDDPVTADDPADERHELMEGVKDAAKPVGEMFEGDIDFDQETVMASLHTFADAAEKIGDLVPDGSQGGEAAPAIWEDPEGFAAAIVEWQEATAAAIAAEPAALEDMESTLGPVFGACKNCHDTYRIEEE